MFQAAVNAYFPAFQILLLPGTEFEAGNAGNAGQSLSADPRCVISKSSSREESLLVACRLVHSSASARDMPLPSSVTLIMPTPPRRISTRTNLAPASRLFSTSSFTTEAGRSTTSPAATWLARVGDMTWMDGMAMTDWKRLFQKAEP